MENKKLYKIDFGNEKSHYVVASCFRDVVKNFEGRYTTNIQLVAVPEDEVLGEFGNTSKAMPFFTVINDGKEQWNEVLDKYEDASVKVART